MRKERTPVGQLQVSHSRMATGSPAGGMTLHPRPSAPLRKGAFKSSEEEGAPQLVLADLAVPKGRWSMLGRALSTIGHQETKQHRTSSKERSTQICHRALRCCGQESGNWGHPRCVRMLRHLRRLSQLLVPSLGRV